MKTSNSILTAAGLAFAIFAAVNHIAFRNNYLRTATYARELSAAIDKTPIRTLIAEGSGPYRITRHDRQQMLILNAGPTPETVRIEGDTLFVRADVLSRGNLPHLERSVLNGTEQPLPEAD